MSNPFESLRESRTPEQIEIDKRMQEEYEKNKQIYKSLTGIVSSTLEQLAEVIGWAPLVITDDIFLTWTLARTDGELDFYKGNPPNHAYVGLILRKTEIEVSYKYSLNPARFDVSLQKVEARTAPSQDIKIGKIAHGHTDNLEKDSLVSVLKEVVTLERIVPLK